MREHVRPFTAGAGRHSRTHCARKSSIESQATGSESRGEIVTGGAAVWGSGEIQSEKKDGSGRESHGPSGDDGRIFVMYHGTSWRKWQRIRRHGFLPSDDASGLGAASVAAALQLPGRPTVSAGEQPAASTAACSLRERLSMK